MLGVKFGWSILAGLAIVNTVILAGWNFSGTSLPGERVDEITTQSLRGGAVCGLRLKFNCSDVSGQQCANSGTCSQMQDCKAKTNLYTFSDIAMEDSGTGAKYCCGSSGICGAYWSNYMGCATSPGT